MTAIEFVKKFGICNARKIIKDQNEESFYWCNYCGNGGNQEDLFILDTNQTTFEYCPSCDSDNTLRCRNQFSDLKRLVESWELVESIGGLEFAKNFIKLTGSTMDNMLEQAIADVESCQ